MRAAQLLLGGATVLALASALGCGGDPPAGASSAAGAGGSGQGGSSAGSGGAGSGASASGGQGGDAPVYEPDPIPDVGPDPPSCDDPVKDVTDGNTGNGLTGGNDDSAATRTTTRRT